MLSSVFDLFGTKSPISVMARGLMERAQRLMSNLTVGIIPNAGHTLNMEQSEIINSRVLEFLSSN